MIILETERLIIRNWREKDRELMHRLNHDDQIMEFFPFRRNREESDQLYDRFYKMIVDTGYGFYALERKDNGECIGFCGLAETHMEPFFKDGTVEIGWRLIPETWGKGYVSEAANALLEYGFMEKNLDEIVSFAVHNNERSTAVMKRIGMNYDQTRDFSHPNVSDNYPQLQPHVTYVMSRDEFLQKRESHSE
ncbi:GNAT family N-acetyltransferase [Paenochrobactrum pullorum]|uniref:GNAT family N-acetyltransferase n=1 Tax=Paenochrobactrum pullorum TaxID=1324351 RepID=UPI0035BC7A69